MTVAMTERGRALSSIRLRLLAWFMLLLTLASVTSILVVRQVLLNRLDERIDRELVQETRELRILARGIDPATGAPFAGRVRKIFATYLERNIPSRNEALITFVNGEPFLRSRRVVPYRLDQDPRLVERWGDLTQTERGRVSTRAGDVEYLAVPLRSERAARGVFVVAMFRDLEQEETESGLIAAAATGIFVLLVGSVLAWRLADMILTPVRKVQTTALSISESDLTRRIEVEGHDEISALATTFNEMLDRIEEAFSAQKRFIDDASHELRTPITIIRGHLETIDADPDDRARTISLLLDELDRMTRLVDDLLLLARSQRSDLLDLALADVERLTVDIHAKATALGAREWVLAECAKGWVEADAHRITQAVIQLAQNASQNTSEGDVIEIGSKIADGEARFWVTDSGRGIAPEDQGRIFERFEQARHGRQRASGSGLGLAIVDAIARAHHGRVEVESALGRGSTFRLVIPLDQPEEEHDLMETTT